jgi:hypothetical protein
MLKFCRDAWYENKDKLEAVIMMDTKLNSCDYSYLVELVIEYILNPSIETGWKKFDAKNITVIDNGDYQGTILFMIPRKTYQPNFNDYLLTYSYYGSCSGCDTLLSIQDWEDGVPTENQVKDYMALCKDLVCNIVKPYNYGWQEEEEFAKIADVDE